MEKKSCFLPYAIDVRYERFSPVNTIFDALFLRNMKKMSSISLHVTDTSFEIVASSFEPDIWIVLILEYFSQIWQCAIFQTKFKYNLKTIKYFKIVIVPLKESC